MILLYLCLGGLSARREMQVNMFGAFPACAVIVRFVGSHATLVTGSVVLVLLPRTQYRSWWRSSTLEYSNPPLNVVL